MSVSMRIDQSVELTVAFMDRRGNPVEPTDPIVWSGGGSITPSADGKSAVVVPSTVGDSQVTASSGSLSATMDITTTQALPASMTITAADPVDLP